MGREREREAHRAITARGLGEAYAQLLLTAAGKCRRDEREDRLRQRRFVGVSGEIDDAAIDVQGSSKHAVTDRRELDGKRRFGTRRE